MDTKQQACIIAKCIVKFKWLGRRGWRAWAFHQEREVLDLLLSVYGGRIDKVRGKLVWNIWGNKVKELASDANPYLTKAQRYNISKYLTDERGAGGA